jgi:hypothetical protein
MAYAVIDKMFQRKTLKKKDAVSTTIRTDEAVELVQLFNKFIYAGHMLVKRLSNLESPQWRHFSSYI